MKPLEIVRDAVWQDMITNLKSRKQVDLQKLKDMVRSGIPASERADAWVVLSKSASIKPLELMKGQRQRWMVELLTQKLKDEELNQICMDIPRT